MIRFFAAVIVVPLTVGSLFGAVPVADDTVLWQFDSARSDIRFELAALGLIPVRGTFERFDGRVWREAHDGSLRVEIRIDAESLTMDSQRYRDWARSNEFFHVRRYPDIVFRSDAISDDVLLQGGELSGRLTLRGVERPARFELDASQCMSERAGCELRVTGEVDRRQYGMRSRRVTLSSRVSLDMRFWAAPMRPAASLQSAQ